MSLFELSACVEGYNEAHGGEPALEPPSAEEFADMVERHRAVIEG